jgi:hypothetical protein
MFNERELLIMSYAVDRIAHTPDLKIDPSERFFSPTEADLLCGKIHNMLRAIRSERR